MTGNISWSYRRFLAHEGLADRISATLADLDVEDTRSLAEAGAQIRDLVEGQPFPVVETWLRLGRHTVGTGRAVRPESMPHPVMMRSRSR